MSKPSKRPGREARDIHQVIQETAERMRNAPAFDVRDTEEFPEVDRLMSCIREDIERAIPRMSVFEGRPYWVTVRMPHMLVDIFANPGDARPLIQGATFSRNPHGHKPGH